MQLKSNLPDTAENRLKETFFIVEANHFEYMELWSRHSDEGLYEVVMKRTGEPAYKKVKWEEGFNGWSIPVGEVYKNPVCISVNWARINGRLVMFWHPISCMVNHKFIDKWLEENFKGTYDNGHRRASTDAMNFGHCLNAIKEANEQELKEV